MKDLIMNNNLIPIPVTHLAAGVPGFLKHLPQWLHWAANEEKDNGRFNKVPVSTSGFNINAHDPRNLKSFEEVVSAFNPNVHSGIAIDLTGKKVRVEDSRQQAFLIGVDLDQCVTGRRSDGAYGLTPHAQQIVEALSSYWELSPSGKGIRAFFYSNVKIPGRNKGGVEIYSEGRFLTVTGHGQGDMRMLSDSEVPALLSLLFGTVSDLGGLLGVGVTKTPVERAPDHLNYPRETPEAVAKLDAALRAIPPTVDRGTWVKVLLSAKAHGFECVESKLRAWSESAGPYDKEKNPMGYDAKAFDDVWRTEPREISHRSLYFIASQFEDSTDPLSYGDTLNGRRFAELHRQTLLYCYPRGKWLLFDGLRWAWCDDSDPLQAAKATASDLLHQATEAFQNSPQSTDAKKALSQARDAFNLKRLQAMITCAASEPGMHVAEMSELDSDPMLLGCRNGAIDLRTGELLSSRPEQLITKTVSANYDPDALCPRWEKFLDEVSLGDIQTVDYLQKMAGYFLTGKVQEEVLHFFHGYGRNGKSVFANVLTHLLGDYVLTAPAEMLMRREKGGATNDVARLVGIRLLMANETRNGQAFDDLMLKTLVSTERMSARFLYQEFFDFWPTHKILIRGNHKPMITDETEGAWRRIRLVPFDLRVDEDNIDSGLEETLLGEAEGILAWAVRGCLAWQKEGLAPSPRINSASACYRSECDLIGEFLEGYTLDPQGQISQQTLWDEWRSWCQDNGVREGSKKTFTRKLEVRGVRAAGWKGSIRQYTGARRRTKEELRAMTEPF
jgi:P4 family phage/plasmid primase-like protien